MLVECKKCGISFERRMMVCFKCDAPLDGETRILALIDEAVELRNEGWRREQIVRRFAEDLELTEDELERIADDSAAIVRGSMRCENEAMTKATLPWALLVLFLPIAVPFILFHWLLNRTPETTISEHRN